MEDHNIPIEINSGKLLEWLISRRHCTVGWQTRVITIREKINNAIQDMPKHDEIAKLLEGTYINYFHCKKIVEILKETEADSKNLFGRYGSQRMKDWQEVIRLYENDNLYLAEVAQMLIRNVTYEVPNVKKQIQKMEQTKHDHEKKHAEHKKSENSARVELRNMCKNWKIEGENTKKELVAQLEELPAIYEDVMNKAQNLRPVVEFYAAFVHFLLGRYHDGGCVPMVQYLLDKGNTTTYQWTYGEVPQTVIDPPLNIDIKEEQQSTEAENLADNADASIDFNETVELNEGGEIDWGDIDLGEENNDNGNIDFNISLEESGIEVEGADGGVAKGEEALTILDNPKTREEFINQLIELESFCKLRVHEMKNENSNDLLSLNLMHDVPTLIQLQTTDSMEEMLTNVQAVLLSMQDSRLHHLHNIKHSSKYVDMVIDSLHHKRNVIHKVETVQKNLEIKRDEVIKQISSTRDILELLIKRTKELQVEIEQDLSKKYDNRIVRLIGGINNM